MRILVVGANGLLGSNVVHTAQKRSWVVSGTYHSTKPVFDIPLTQFDLREHATFDEVLSEHDPDVVVNCAAMTDVDVCEKNPDMAATLNGEAPGELAAHCETYDISFVHISTDYVFDGDGRDAYVESDEPAPRQAYGKSKLIGEETVAENIADTLIARLSFVWGIHRSSGNLTGFPAWVCDQLTAGADVPLFTDQWITPTRAGQAAETLLDLIDQSATGLFHVACRSCVTPYGFGKLLTEHRGDGDAVLIEGSMADVDREATRPQYTCLNVEKVESTLKRPQPTLDADIDTVNDAIR